MQTASCLLQLGPFVHRIVLQARSNGGGVLIHTFIWFGLLLHKALVEVNQRCKQTWLTLWCCSDWIVCLQLWLQSNRYLLQFTWLLCLTCNNLLVSPTLSRLESSWQCILLLTKCGFKVFYSLYFTSTLWFTSNWTAFQEDQGSRVRVGFHASKLYKSQKTAVLIKPVSGHVLLVPLPYCSKCIWTLYSFNFFLVFMCLCHSCQVFLD